MPVACIADTLDSKMYHNHLLMIHAIGVLRRKWGRKRTMLLAGVLFDIGVVITATAPNLALLILGRVLLGVAVAFASVAVTLYLSEMAPAHIRGRLNQIFQVLSTGEAAQDFKYSLAPY